MRFPCKKTDEESTPEWSLSDLERFIFQDMYMWPYLVDKNNPQIHNLPQRTNLNIRQLQETAQDIINGMYDYKKLVTWWQYHTESDKEKLLSHFLIQELLIRRLVVLNDWKDSLRNNLKTLMD